MSDTLTLDEIQPGEHAAPGTIGVIPIDSIIVPEEMGREHGDLAGLAASIRAHGLLNPPTVNQTPEGFVLIAGGRRIAAARLAGLAEIPVHVKATAEQSQVRAMRLVENVQRHNLHPLDEAEGYEQLRREHGMNQQAIAKAVGRSPLHVSNRLKLLGLAPDVRSLVGVPEGLSIGEAEIVARISDHDSQGSAVKRILDGGRAEEVVAAHLRVISSHQAEAEARSRLGEQGLTEFTGSLGRDGFLVSREEPEPGKLYWPQDRPDAADFAYQVNADASVSAVSTNPGAHEHDEDVQVAASARALGTRREVAEGTAGTDQKPLQPLDQDEASKERAKAERGRLRMLKRRDEEREAHLNKVVRKAVAYPRVGDFVLASLLEAVPASAREVAFTRLRVPRGDREDGFGQEWKI